MWGGGGEGIQGRVFLSEDALRLVGRVQTEMPPFSVTFQST